MTFRFIDQVIGDYMLNLDALVPNTDLYTTLLFQYNGTFNVEANRFGSMDDAADRFNAFLRVAKAEHSSIAITPEYSCPWRTIRWILDNADNRPGDSKLWALGCVSITPAELRAIREQYQSENVIIHFDETVLDRGVNVLLNPLCYVFNMRSDVTGQLKLVLLIQFKTEHMGVWATDAELERYIPGEEIYVLRNGAGSIALFTMICSETDTFQISEDFRMHLDHRWNENPFIILNIQMNPQPTATFFKTFRNGILNYSNKDIITLNWSSESKKANGHDLLAYSKSSISYGSHQMDFVNEQKFLDNHFKGLYYTNKQQDRHVYFLNGKQQVFLISHRKPVSGGHSPSMHRRSGPVATKLFTWDVPAALFIENESTSDGFIEFLDAHNCDSAVLRDSGTTFIEKERMANISCGLVKSKSPDRVWHTVDKLSSFLLEDDEIIRRLTFVHDKGGDESRQKYLEAIDTINKLIIPTSALFPTNHAVFAGHCDVVMFRGSGPNKYKFNLVTIDGTQKATAAYIGRNTLAKAENTVKSLRELFDEEDQARKRVIVWYKRDAQTIVAVCDIRKPTLRDDSKSKPISISRQP